MVLLVEVVVEDPDRAPVGAPVHVQVRDTSLADVEAPLVAERSSEVADPASGVVQTVRVDVPDAMLAPPRRLSVFVHVDVDRNGVLSAGDLITTQSFPVPRAAPGHEARLRVTVVPI